MPQPHCWTGRREDLEARFGWNSLEYMACWDDNWKNGTCLLDDGHDGPHEFTDDDQILISFPDKES